MKNQKGFTLLELLLVLTLSTGIAMVTLQDKNLENEQFKARKLGMELFQVNSAIQNYLAHHSGDTNPSSLNQTYTNINWLKSTTCGGTSPDSWLPCNFLSASGGKTTFGRLSFTTTVKYDPVEGLTARTSMSPLTLGTSSKPQTRGDLSGLAALVASGAYAISDDNRAAMAQDSTVAYCPDTTGTSPIAAVCQGQKDVIVMLAQNISAGDRWLRVDHGNVMQNTLEFQTNSTTPATKAQLDAVDTISRQIRNVARIYNLGNSGNDNLYLGKKLGNGAVSTATLTQGAVIIDADQEVLGQLVVKNNMTVSGNASVTGKLSVTNDTSLAKDLTVAGKTTTAGDFTAKANAQVDGRLTAVGDIKGNANLTISGNGNFGGTVTSSNINSSGTFNGNNMNISGISRFSNSIYAPKMIDSDNNNYYVDPSSLSNMTTVHADNLYSRGNTDVGGNLQTWGTIRGLDNIISSKSIFAQHLFANAIVTEGTSCGGTTWGVGTIARGGSGQIMTCQTDGLWHDTSRQANRQLRSYTWSQGEPELNTGLSTQDWYCALTHIRGKYQGGERVTLSTAGGIWKMHGWSDQSGVQGTATCINM